MSEPALRGQAAFVTGGGSGIGLACAMALVRDGATVTIAGRSEDRLRSAVAQLEAAAIGDATVCGVACDVGDEASVAAAVERAAQPTGGLHLAVASAGTGTVAPILATPVEEWNRVIETNLTGTFLTLKHAGGAIARSGGGAMVTISSIAGVITHPYMGPYCASKAGIDMLVRVAADELGRMGVRVNTVQPGLTRTELGDFLIDDPLVLADYMAQSPVSQVSAAEDVAAAVRYLLGPESRMVTGTAITVDGGHHLRRGPDIEHWARAMYGDAMVDGPLSEGDAHDDQ